jgi:hypothetical protein
MVMVMVAEQLDECEVARSLLMQRCTACVRASLVPANLEGFHIELEGEGNHTRGTHSCCAVLAVVNQLKYANIVRVLVHEGV